MDEHRTSHYSTSILLLAVALTVAVIAPSANGQTQDGEISYQQFLEANRLAATDSTFADADQTVLPGWWQPLVALPMELQPNHHAITLEQILISALENSKQIDVFSELPLIRETAITEAAATFDWNHFLESRWDDTSEPIGNTLTAGTGVNRFRDHHLTATAGARKRTYSGGRLQIGQQFGFQDNNSQFFVPDPQGTTRLALSFTQPLMRGRGQVYNTGLIVLAKLDKAAADDELNRQLQAHLLEVARGYWSLYLERAALLQRINSYTRGKKIHDVLDKRQAIDATPSQLASAVASVMTRRSDLARAQASVKNAESRLRSLVNDATINQVELLPVDMPTFEILPVELEESVSIAFQQRPEIAQAIKQIKSAGVRLRLSKNELMPVLNLVTEAYLSGLQDQGRVGEAFLRQFDTGEPSYAFGLQYERPYRNRAANARLKRRTLELRQLQSQYQTTLETIRLEVEVAVREVQTSQQELFAKRDAMTARQLQLDSLERRWKALPGDDLSAGLALENLLLAQDRLAETEFEYLKAQLTHSLSYINLKKATGMLLHHEQVEIGQACAGGVPEIIISKQPAAPLFGDAPTSLPDYHTPLSNQNPPGFLELNDGTVRQ